MGGNMTEEQIKFTAQRLTANTAAHSMALQLPETSNLRKAADAYFKERDLFGIRGWASEEEAEQQIRAHLRSKAY